LRRALELADGGYRALAAEASLLHSDAAPDGWEISEHAISPSALSIDRVL
jgi:hypothetical protein